MGDVRLRGWAEANLGISTPAVRLKCRAAQVNALVGAKAMISTGATTRSSQAAPSGDFDALDHASPDMAEAGPPRGEPGFCDALRYFRTTNVSR